TWCIRHEFVASPEAARACANSTGQSQCLPQTKSDDTNGAIHPELRDVRSGDQSQMTEEFSPLRRRWAASIILRLATAMSSSGSEILSHIRSLAGSTIDTLESFPSGRDLNALGVGGYPRPTDL